jgi:hypothetical protein
MISIQLEIMADVKALSDLGDRMGYVYLIAITFLIVHVFPHAYRT